MIEFPNQILFVGYGAVAECTLPILFKHLKVPARNVTIMDFEDRAEKLKKWTAKGVRFVRDRVTEENMGTLLAKHLGAGDVLIDLAWNIDALEILQWCHEHGVRYINTSTELWDPYKSGNHPTEKTLYWRHMNLRRMTARWKEKGPTAVIEHGANPGLISHFTKQGLIDIGRASIADKKLKGKDAEFVAQLIAEQKFNLLAQKLGVKVIHCSERDTQVTDRPKQVGEFVNTWSIEGFREEGTTTAEMGWGTHEKWLPPLAYKHKTGPQNQICLARMGLNTWVRSWVPHYSILGMVVRHGEAFTISDKLTVWDKTKAVYRPTVHYAYCPCDSAIVSLNELRGSNYKLQEKLRIMNDEITSGSDILGALLMGHGYNSWWIGSDLSIAPVGAEPKCHHDAGRDLGRRRDDVDDREPGAGGRGARRAAARLRARHRETLPRQVHLDAVGLDAVARLHQRLPRLQQTRPRSERPVAVPEFPDQGRRLT